MFQNQVNVGKVTDSMEVLERLCHEKAKEMAETITENAEYTFWTSDIPAELICVARFNINEDGKCTYTLDFSQTTL